MRTQRFITIVCLLLWTVAHLHAYEKRDLLQKEADFEKVKSALIMGQKWVPYPDYSDRAGWDKFLGDYKEDYIRKGNRLSGIWTERKPDDYGRPVWQEQFRTRKFVYGRDGRRKGTLCRPDYQWRFCQL